MRIIKSNTHIICMDEEKDAKSCLNKLLQTYKYPSLKDMYANWIVFCNTMEESKKKVIDLLYNNP